MTISVDCPGLDVAKLRSFARMIPAIYAGVSFALAVQLYLFSSIEPWPLTHGAPLCIILMTVYGGLRWSREARLVASDEEARAKLQTATCFLIVAVMAEIAVLLNVFARGDEQMRHFVVYLLQAFGMCVFVGLMHLHMVAIAVSLMTFGLCAALMLAFDTPAMFASAMITIVLAWTFTMVMLNYHNDFVQLARSRLDIERLGSENARLASLDMLTGLPNRRHFFTTLSAAIQAAGNTPVAVGIVDLDGFKPVNDTYGHRVGDRVLAEVAKRLSQASPEMLEVCRIGGDEFAFFVKGKSAPAELIALGDQLMAALAEPIAIDDLLTSVGCSLGFAVYPDMALTADLLFERADFALYHAKHVGRGRSEIFSEEHQAHLALQGSIEQTLRTANLDKELYPVFQPLVDTQTGRTMAFECLARWNSPTLGHSMPGSFIPVAERAGLITRITLIMLRKTLTAMAEWPLDVGLSFNLSAHDLVSPACTVQLLSVIMNSGIDPKRISFEITETALLNDFHAAELNIALIKRAGIRVALDDFGTGFSSLSHIHTLPLDKLKVDRQFVANIESNESSRNIVRSVLALCADMGIECVVEGAETEGQLAVLNELGCKVVQGYYYSKPIGQDEVAGYLGRFKEPAARSA